MNLAQTIETARNVLRFRHMAYRTEQAYLHWIGRYGHWCLEHRDGVHAEKVRGFLTHLAREREVSASTLAPNSQSIYSFAVTDKDVIGIGVPNGAARSRRGFALRLFCRLGVSSNGRPGGRGREARRCSIGTPTPVSVAHPIGVGWAVQNRNWSTSNG